MRKKEETMKRTSMLLFVLGFLVLFPLALLSAEKETPTAPEKERQQQEKASAEAQKRRAMPVIPVYKPPQVGAPGGRVGGGTRGVGDESIVIAALAPNHVGLSIQEQPTLYWYLSRNAKYPLEFAISEESSVNPLMVKRIAMPERGGIYAIRLKEHDLHLQTGVTYRWFVAVVPDPERRSKDILAGGMIKRVAASPELRAKLSQADRNGTLFLYADEGIWYDLLMATSEAIEEKPGDENIQAYRSALLQQVGLSDVIATQ
jgi:hypothetical protein